MNNRRFNILLIGDSCIDEYYYGTCDRLNPEAPVPVLNIIRTETRFGMAANVKDNLEAFGCNVTFMTGLSKSIKKRFIDDRSKQHIVRVDEDRLSEPFNPYKESLRYSNYDAIVISDYNKGLIQYETVEIIRSKFNGPIFIDSKKTNLSRFQGCYVKINSIEYAAATSYAADMIVTLGKAGAQYKDQIYQAESVEVVDVCGAGDTFLAALTSHFLKSNSIEDAIKFAIAAATISVKYRGVYSLTDEDISSIILQ